MAGPHPRDLGVAPKGLELAKQSFADPRSQAELGNERVGRQNGRGRLGGLKYPLVSDLKRQISEAYGVLTEDGVALRGTFLIDKNGILRHALINDLPLGRNIDEAIRLIDALQFFEQHGEVCPANWKPGALSIDTKNAGKYFKAANA